MGIRQLVLVADTRELGRRVDEDDVVGGLRLLEHENARGDGRAEEEVGRKLDHSIHVVVVDQVLADLRLGSAAVHDSGELDDRRRAVDGQPAENVHREGEVGLRLGGEHTGGGESRIVDEERVRVASHLIE